MILTPAQNQIAADTHRFRVANCGRRFGKTVLAIEEIKGKAFAKQSRIAYIGPTIQQTRDIVWEQLKKELQAITLYVNDTRLEIKVKTVKGDESLIVLRGWEAIETLRGQSYDFIVIDEIASMRNWDEKWQEVIRPTLTDRKGQVLFISTPKGFNHFYGLFRKESEDTDYKSFHFTSYDNPNIPVEELDKARLEVTEDRFAQEYLADFRKTEGLVYKEFDRTKHLFKDEDILGNNGGQLRHHFTFKMAGLDFGYTNPAAIAEIWEDSDGTFWVVSEWYKTGKTNAEIIEYGKSLDVSAWYPDPAEPDRIEEMKRAGMNVREVSKDVLKGIDCVRNLFKTNKLKIHHKCYNLIAELETYSYKEKQLNRNEPEEPIKEGDHLLDAIRYPLFMRLGRQERRAALQSTPSMSHVYGRRILKPS